MQTTYNKIIADGISPVLSWSFPQTGGIVMADFNDIVSIGEDLGIVLPNATLQSAGQSIIFNNIGEDAIFLRDYLGHSIIKGEGGSDAPLLVGQIVQIYLTSNATADGVWQVIPYANGINSIASISFTSTNNTILINDEFSEIVGPPTGAINLELGEKLTTLDNQLGDNNGYIVFSELNGVSTWSTRTFINGDGNIEILYTDGVSANTSMNLADSITIADTVSVNGVVINNQGITQSSDEDILNINAAAGVSVNGVVIESTGNIALNNLVVTGAFDYGPMPKGWCYFVDTITGITSNITVNAKAGIISNVTGTNGIYTVSFSPSLTNNNYAVFLTLGRSPTSSIVPFNGFVSSKNNSSCVIYAMDSLGNILPVEGGISVMIMSL